MNPKQSSYRNLVYAGIASLALTGACVLGGIKATERYNNRFGSYTTVKQEWLIEKESLFFGLVRDSKKSKLEELLKGLNQAEYKEDNLKIQNDLIQESLYLENEILSSDRAKFYHRLLGCIVQNPNTESVLVSDTAKFYVLKTILYDDELTRNPYHLSEYIEMFTPTLWEEMLKDNPLLVNFTEEEQKKLITKFDSVQDYFSSSNNQR